jgi:iron complex outermembrane receptor protein
VTIAVSANANGDPTPLQFANVDAEIFAFDTSFGFRINDRWRIDGNAAYLRGKRRDVNDDLYRLSPPNLRVGLSWQRGQWHVSGTLTNDPTNPKNTSDGSSGFALTNVYAQYATDDGIDLTLGVENVWDKKHGEPLSGFNRNSSSPVPIGQRLPGRGRNAFLRVHFVM